MTRGNATRPQVTTIDELLITTQKKSVRSIVNKQSKQKLLLGLYMKTVSQIMSVVLIFSGAQTFARNTGAELVRLKSDSVQSYYATASLSTGVAATGTAIAATEVGAVVATELTVAAVSTGSLAAVFGAIEGAAAFMGAVGMALPLP